MDVPPIAPTRRTNAEHHVSAADLLVHTPGSGAIVLASSWNQRSPVHPERTSYDYGRGAGPNQDALASVLGGIYPAAQAISLCCSGMAAISCAIEGALAATAPRGRPAVALVHKEVYGGTDRLLEYLASTRSTFSYVALDLNNSDWFEQETQAAEAKGASIGLIYAESCSNPSGFMLDIESLAVARDRLCSDAPLVVDNSWLSALYDPMAHGADVVIESLTKHVGAGHLIGGMLAFASTPLGAVMHRRATDHAEATGQHMSPFDAWQAETSAATLSHRVRKASRRCAAVARFLEAHPLVGRVIHPSLASHPDADMAARLLARDNRPSSMLLGPTALLFYVPLDVDAATRMADSSRVICYATSYGKAVPLFDPYIAAGSADHYDTPKGGDGGQGSWIRLAMGHAVRAETVCDELDRLLTLHIASAAS